MLKKFTLILIITVLLSTSSLFAICEEVNLGPLFTYKNYPNENKKHITALGPFFMYKLDGKHKEYGFRPLFYYENDLDKNKTDVDEVFL